MTVDDKLAWLEAHGNMQYGAPSPSTGRTYCYWSSRNSTAITKYGQSTDELIGYVFDEAKETLFERSTWKLMG